MTTKTEINGQDRKTLASQLDRLDSILDSLSEGLNEAVASAVHGAVELAVRQAVGQAVKETLQAVIAEALNNADLIAAFRNVAPGTLPAETTVNPPEPPKGLFRRACDGVKAGLGVAANACAALLGPAAVVKSVARAAWQLAKRFKGRLLTACGVGIAAGVVTYLAGPWVGVAAAWVGGFVTTLAVQAPDGLRRLLAPAAAFA